jgi:hypothetical protein
MAHNNKQPSIHSSLGNIPVNKLPKPTPKKSSYKITPKGRPSIYQKFNQQLRRDITTTANQLKSSQDNKPPKPTKPKPTPPPQSKPHSNRPPEDDTGMRRQVATDVNDNGNNHPKPPKADDKQPKGQPSSIPSVPQSNSPQSPQSPQPPKSTQGTTTPKKP